MENLYRSEKGMIPIQVWYEQLSSSESGFTEGKFKFEKRNVMQKAFDFNWGNIRLSIKALKLSLQKPQAP